MITSNQMLHIICTPTKPGEMLSARDSQHAIDPIFSISNYTGHTLKCSTVVCVMQDNEHEVEQNLNKPVKHVIWC